MAKNLKLRIKVEFVETEEDVSSDRHPEEQADGSFSLVLPEADELTISALDRAALDVSFPALREALSGHLAEAGKKTPAGNRAPEPGGRPAGASVRRPSGR
ncbi:MAG: hypothetical protein N838_32260 [Thiohalocapsa sp. PB-PSB1]|jgi:hypothetical protein|nr:MAG: hypothetical protein N838_32260 [Thiohalocapsa sp. PB-PSB1]HCS89088.1 hypothetical protein [Chromatiaceae bacterium]